MHIADASFVEHIVSSYGYYAIFLVIMGESAGVPMPGETVLITASLFAGTRHGSDGGLDIRLVIAAAATAAILGDNIGYWVGRSYGGRVLQRFGPRVGLDERKQKLGQYLFKRYGGALVFFGRFAALLRTFAALLAGINRLSPLTFFLYNAAGGVVWATLFGLGGYGLGRGIERIAGPIGFLALAGALAGAVLLWRFYKRHEEELLATAEREMDGAPGQTLS